MHPYHKNDFQKLQKFFFLILTKTLESSKRHKFQNINQKEGENTMDSKTLSNYKALLLKEKKRLLHHANERIVSEFVLSQEDLPDETDLAASENQQSLALSLRDREYKLLVRIEKALEKIKEGNFGICEECEEQIETRRLEARPMSNLCISCQEQEEHLTKIYA